MSEKTLKFNNIRLNKKEFHKSKEPIDLLSINVDQIVVSDKFKHNNEGFKYFIGYLEGWIVKPLCIILPQVNGYIKYFENVGNNMSFLIKGAEATCVKIGNEMKKSSRLKEMSNFNILWNLQPI